jgi:hypothetical protein
MIRRFVTTAIFFLFGLFSIVVWSRVDLRLCAIYPNMCKPKPGTCGGIDVCSTDAHMLIGLALLLMAPPVLFGILGLVLSKRRAGARLMLSCLLAAVAAHWVLTFFGTRVVAF